MIHGTSLTEPAVAAYPSFAPHYLSNLSTSASLNENPVLNGHPTTANGFSPANSAAVAALTAAAAAAPNIKDSRWLTLEVCRRFQRNQCLRDENECKFAHPPTHVDVQDGRVVCCYDSIKSLPSTVPRHNCRSAMKDKVKTRGYCKILRPLA
ncbi:hypothetical protein X801_09057 [Opisthorchis viverrini]|uniref:C3H1-type domain-containing protein n=1 Tax=Opisthorchis viverrini TaxID=6198 RepID=A0A1S8WL21_OPIVI|nr:hypothetical protein X801_09057 [Opisthorchis viverrini]